MAKRGHSGSWRSRLGRGYLERSSLQRLVALSALLFLLAASFVSWRALEGSDAQVRAQFGHTLVAVNDTVAQALHLPLERHAREAHEIAADPLVAQAVAALAAQSRDPDAGAAGTAVERF